MFCMAFMYVCLDIIMCLHQYKEMFGLAKFDPPYRVVRLQISFVVNFIIINFILTPGLSGLQSTTLLKPLRVGV